MENIDTEEIVETEENLLTNPIEVIVEKPDKRKKADNPKRSKQLEQLKLAREKKKAINLAKKQKRQEIEIRIQKEMDGEMLDVKPIERTEPILVEKAKSQKRRIKKPEYKEPEIEQEQEQEKAEEVNEEEEEEQPFDPEPIYSDPRIPINKRKPKLRQRPPPVRRQPPPTRRQPPPQRNYYDQPQQFEPQFEQPHYTQPQPQYHEPRYQRPPTPQYDERTHRLNNLRNSIFGS